MPWLLACGVGVAVGARVGYVAEHIRVAPILQSVGSAGVSLIGGIVGMAVVWALRPRGLGAVSVGVSFGPMLYLAIFIAVVAVAHALLGRSGVPVLAAHRPMILG